MTSSLDKLSSLFKAMQAQSVRLRNTKSFIILHIEEDGNILHFDLIESLS